MSRFELLVGSDAFWQRARQDIATATERVLVQAMTFEGDRAGLAVAAAVDTSRAVDRRVLVDSYSRFFVSDRFVLSPLAQRDPAFRAEVRETAQMFERLARRGVGVVFTNPYGFLGARLPARNHKKLLILDGVAYLGGINFSDHNFVWHDLMVRCDDRAIADYLALDFTRTFQGEPIASEASFEGTAIFSLSGVDNPLMFARLVERIDRARERIEVCSAYLTFPFCEALARARKRGVQVTLFTPLANNKPIIRDYLLWAARRFDFDVRLCGRMSHVKAMLIDDRELVLGSSNFDFVSYHTQAEIVAVLTDRELVAAFRREVLEDEGALAGAVLEVDGLRGLLAFLALKVAEGATRISGARLRAEHARSRARRKPPCDC